MKQNTNTHLIRGVCVILCFSSVNLYAEDVTSQEDVSIRLHVPYTALLPGERLTFSVTVCNNSLSDLYYLPFGSRLDMSEEYERLQLFFETKHSAPLPSPELGGPERVYTVEKDGKWDKVVDFEGVAVLKPTEAVTWHSNEVGVLSTIEYRGLHSLKAKFLIGPNQWISSNAISIEHVKPDREPVVVLACDYVGTGRTSRPLKFYIVSILSRDYLFASKVFRVCEIPKGHSPEFVWEPRLGLLQTRFSGNSRSSDVWYSIKKVRTLNGPELTEYYREAYNFEYGDADYKQRALKGMAWHGTAASVQLFDKYEGSNGLLLQHRDRYECIQLLLHRAATLDEAQQARQLIRQALFAHELQLDSEEKITLPPLVFHESEAQKAADLLGEFVESTGRAILTVEDIAKITTLITHLKETAQEKQEAVAVDPDSEMPKIAPNLSSLSDPDIQTLARDALSRFASTHAHNSRFHLARLGCLDFYSDSKQSPGKLELDYDYILRNNVPYEPSVRDVFGDYDSLPESVREVVLNEDARVLDGEQYTRPLGLKTIMWSNEQRRVQITLAQPWMPSMSYTFLYHVEHDGALRFTRSEPMGCAFPEGFIRETSEQESQPR